MSIDVCTEQIRVSKDRLFRKLIFPLKSPVSTTNIPNSTKMLSQIVKYEHIFHSIQTGVRVKNSGEALSKNIVLRPQICCFYDAVEKDCLVRYIKKICRVCENQCNFN